MDIRVLTAGHQKVVYIKPSFTRIKLEKEEKAFPDLNLLAGLEIQRGSYPAGVRLVRLKAEANLSTSEKLRTFRPGRAQLLLTWHTGLSSTRRGTLPSAWIRLSFPIATALSQRA